MSKITRKLFLYFVIVSLVLAGTAFAGFYGTFRYYSYQEYNRELQDRAEVIRARLEHFMRDCNGAQELSAYIKVLDDVTLADAYFISREGETFTCPCPCRTTVKIEKKPSAQVEQFAQQVFESGQYMQVKDAKRDYVGIPVREGAETTAVVVIVDTFEVDRGSFLMAVASLLGCLAAASLLASAVARNMARKFMEPIHRIAFTVSELACGNYHVKTEVRDQNEIGNLARQTDLLAEKLEETDKERARMEQMQKDYIANLSHELRTPVTVIRSSMEALYDGMVPEEKVKEYQKQMLSETISLQRLINDMLELSRLENKDFPISRELLDLRTVLEDAARSVRMLAREKRIQVKLAIPEEELPFEGDYGRLKQMFLAVLDNSVKYSDPDKTIRVQITVKSDDYYIVIEDEGCGIARDKISRIFDKFYRLSKERAPGTGLGMVIVKSIADRHQIDIRIQSEEGKGTKITFIVPVYKRY